MPISDKIKQVSASIVVDLLAINTISLVLMHKLKPNYSLIRTRPFLFMKEDREKFLVDLKTQNRVLDYLKMKLVFKLGSMGIPVFTMNIRYMKLYDECDDILHLFFYTFIERKRLGMNYHAEKNIVPAVKVIVSDDEDFIPEMDKNIIYHFSANRENFIANQSL